MKHVTIVGIGTGMDTITREGQNAIEEAEVLFGAPRMLEACSHLKKPCFPIYEPNKIKAIVDKSELSRFAILVSGDTGFFSAADGLLPALTQHEVKLLPGISSVSYFFAKIKRPWQGVALVSCHGRNNNLVDTVRRNSATLALTGDNIGKLSRQLEEADFGTLTANVGENLGMDDEHIFSLPVSELTHTRVGKLAVLLIDNPNADARVRFGIPDEQFVRGDVPMTKAEVRAVSLSRLALAPHAICCDIGAGTGSVTVEIASAVYNGHVYAIDRNEASISLLKENCWRFHLGNVTPVLGSAPEALSSLPPFDAAFIGGSGGAMAEIFDAILDKNPLARIVVNAITLETLSEAIIAFKKHGIAPEIIQLGSARAKSAGGLHMMLAQNPVFILSGGDAP